jgi:hypothetical protein
MKNRKLINALKQFDNKLQVSMTAVLKHGCEEVGTGFGEWQGKSFTQDYAIQWNDGELVCDESEGYTVGDVIGVLSEKDITELSHNDFKLRPGELKNGYSEYTTKWDDGEPDEEFEDSQLYSIMELGDSEYRWNWPSYLEIYVHYIDEELEGCTIGFLLKDK